MTSLDQAELLQLAAKACTDGDSGTAIVYLKEAVARTDGSAMARYLLGAEYASIRMYDRAVEEMEAALALDPALSIVRLQLGLLLLTCGDAARSADVLKGLDDLPETDPMNRFGRGLQHLIHDELADASRCLAEGIALNTVNLPLNGDMQKVIDAIAAVPAGPDAAAAPGAEADGQAPASRHVLLSAYVGNESS